MICSSAVRAAGASGVGVGGAAGLLRHCGEESGTVEPKFCAGSSEQ